MVDKCYFNLPSISCPSADSGLQFLLAELPPHHSLSVHVIWAGLALQQARLIEEHQRFLLQLLEKQYSFHSVFLKKQKFPNMLHILCLVPESINHQVCSTLTWQLISCLSLSSHGYQLRGRALNSPLFAPNMKKQ